MIPTTFVFGAGTSMPFGFPSGFDLYVQVSEKSPTILGSTYTNLLLQNTVPNYSPADANTFIHALKRGTSPSIDRLVQDRNEFDIYARAYIADALLAEEAQKLTRSTSHSYKIERQISMNKSEIVIKTANDNVYMYILGKLSSNDNLLVELQKHNFITFNYDRVFEHVIFNTLVYNLGIPREDAFQHLDNLNIFHVYGSLGKYKGVPTYRTGKRVFSENVDQRDIDTLGESIGSLKLLSTTRNLSKSTDTVSEMFRDTERVVLLGFGYDFTNCSFLAEAYNRAKPNQHRIAAQRPHRSWFGSAMDKLEAERNDIYKLLKIDIDRLGNPKHNDVQFMKDKVSSIG